MIECESDQLGRSQTTTGNNTNNKPTNKSELKHRILNSILSRFSSGSNPNPGTSKKSEKEPRLFPNGSSYASPCSSPSPTAALKSSGPSRDIGDVLQFSDKRIADLIRDGGGAKAFRKPQPTSLAYAGTNFSVNEARLREISHTPLPYQQQQHHLVSHNHHQPLIRPVALRPKKLDSDLSHSFRLSTHEQQWARDLNSNPQRNSRFINRRSTISRSEYPVEAACPRPLVARQHSGATAAATTANAPASNHTTQNNSTSAAETNNSREMLMMMRPRLNLIKMKIHNLIENRPNFDMIHELKETQLRHQRKFQLNTVPSSNAYTKFDLNKLPPQVANNTVKPNNNCPLSTNNGSLVSLTSSTSSLLSSSASSLTSAAYADDNPIYNKFRIDEPKIDLELIESDDS